MEAKESVLADLKSLRRERRKEIRDTRKAIGNPCSQEFVYFLLEPDEEIIRYIGIASQPQSRYDAHLHSSTRKPKTPVALWIKGLVASGTLPRMRVMIRIETHNWRYNTHIDTGVAARAIERELIIRCLNGYYLGNGHLKSRLLNIVYVPDIFLPSGIDAGKDRV